MRGFLALYRREIEYYFVTPIGYIINGGFWLASGFFFSFNTIFVSAVDMVGAFHNMSILLILLVPIMSMRSFAEEYRLCTYELLITLRIKHRSIVLAKFAGLLTIFMLMLMGSAASVAVLVLFSKPDLGPILGGYLGIVLLGSSFVAIGLVVSVFSTNQIVAAVVTWTTLIGMWFLDYTEALTTSKSLSQGIQYVSFSVRYHDLIRGIFDLGSAIYFLSVTITCLVVACSVLQIRR